MVRDIRLVEHWLGTEDLYVSDGVKESRIKLERSIATRIAMEKGSVIREENVHMLSPGDGFKWAEKDEVIGHKIKRDMPANEIIYLKDIE